MSTVSIIVCTNRTQYWERFCAHIVPNVVDKEVIFVGPVSTSGLRLPTAVKHIMSGANPARCWEIGARHCRGDLVCFAPDDIIFTPGFFDAAVTAMSGLGEYDMVTACFYQNNINQFGGMRMMSDPSMPLTPVCGVLRTASHRKLGGVDRRFHAILWDADLYLRFIAAGGSTTLIEGYSCHEVGHDSLMFVNNYQRDLAVIHDLWFVNGKPQCTRRSGVQPYSDSETGI